MVVVVFIAAVWTLAAASPAPDTLLAYGIRPRKTYGYEDDLYISQDDARYFPYFFNVGDRYLLQDEDRYLSEGRYSYYPEDGFGYFQRGHRYLSGLPRRSYLSLPRNKYVRYPTSRYESYPLLMEPDAPVARAPKSDYEDILQPVDTGLLESNAVDGGSKYPLTGTITKNPKERIVSVRAIQRGTGKSLGFAGAGPDRLRGFLGYSPEI
ncbi:uncharacterized protein [Cherax quadricarinatus]|uniref:uncharacterized protein n=1 Tax=Cherax quadricarinatus TaxID=27406 RepID=UPI00387E39D3